MAAEFEALDQNPCGEMPLRPAPGGSREAYQAWLRCDQDPGRTKARNAKLRELKNYRSMRSIMED